MCLKWRTDVGDYLSCILLLFGIAGVILLSKGLLMKFLPYRDTRNLRTVIEYILL